MSVARDREAYHSLLLAVPAVLFLGKGEGGGGEREQVSEGLRSLELSIPQILTSRIRPHQGHWNHGSKDTFSSDDTLPQPESSQILQTC